MKTYALLVTALLFGSIAKSAIPMQPYDDSIPHANPSPFTSNLTFYGADTYYVEASTPTDTPILFVTGSGYYYGTECSSGTIGDLGIAFDAASVAGITVNTQGKALTPFVYSAAPFASNVSTTVATVAVTFIPGSIYGTYTPPSGSKRFVNGVVGLKHGASGTSAACHFMLVTDAEIQSGIH